MQKPALFIASSVEGLSVAEAINLNLDHATQNTLWHKGTFKLGSDGLGDLTKKSSEVDFAVFIFTPDDLVTMRQKEERVARDNVVFELGLFIGALGKDRCYIVKPRNVEMHLPSDLLGITTADYVPDRPDGDISSALNAACKLIKDRVNELGLARSYSPFSASARRVANPPDYKLQGLDLVFLAQCIQSYVAYPTGLSFNSISNKSELNGEPEYLVSLSAVKLTKLGYIEKSIEIDNQNGYEYFSYKATSDGIEIFLKHESQYSQIRTIRSQERKQILKKKSSSGFDEMDDDIPF